MIEIFEIMQRNAICSKTFATGPVIDIVCASCSIPVLFSPVIIDNVHYVDGGVLRNFPVTPIRPFCDIVMGVNVNPMVAKEYKKSIIGIAERSYGFIFKSNTLADMKLCDILIQTKEIIDYNIFDIENLREIAACGYRDTQEVISLDKENLKNLKIPFRT